MHLVRCLKRKTSNSASADLFVRAEFEDGTTGKVELTPSVYHIASNEQIRVRAEHYALCDLEPGNGSVLDMGKHEDVLITEGEKLFEFTRTRHRELRFERESDLINFVESFWDSIEDRQTRVSRPEIGEYVVERKVAQDAEWVEFLKSPKGEKWARLVATTETRLQKQPATPPQAT